jgi:hypothetical protein
MYPLKCIDGKDHSFEVALQNKSYICSTCGITGEEYTKHNNKRKELKLKIQALAEYINSGNPEVLAEAMFDAMCYTPRTIQQDFFRSLVLFIGKMRNMPTDLRNEACVAWCKDVSKIKVSFPRI